MKTVLASLTGLAADRAVLKTAGQVAILYRGHIEALHVHVGQETIRAMSGYAPADALPASAMAADLVREQAQRRAHARAVFDEISLRCGLVPARLPDPVREGPTAIFVEVDGLENDETVRRARYHDLTVVAREAQLLPERLIDLVMGAGRPVLIAPPNPRETIGARIAIAWRPGANAARAVTAAMPFLHKAGRIGLFAVPQAGQTQAAAIASARPLQEALAWHGLQAHIAATEPSNDAAQALREAVYADETDLLVMGAYGHSRLRELILGGVTRSILGECSIPVLMMH